MSGKASHIQHPTDLTKRQQQVLRLLAIGKAPKEMGDALGLATCGHRTNWVKCPSAEYHVARLHKVTHLSSVAELVRLAVRLGMVDTNP